MRKNRTLWTVLFGAVLFGGFMGMCRVSEISAETSRIFPQLEKFTDCLEIIERSYVEEIPPQKLIEGAIRGMTQVLDPHSSYLTEEGYRDMEITITGIFGGLGIEVGMREGFLTVISPIEGTPAFRTGIKPGDKILKIDGSATAEMPLEEAVSLLRGKKGSKVTITIFRETREKPFDVTMERDIIRIQSVKSMMLEPGYGYIKVRSFQKDTAADIEKRLKRMLPLKGLVLDLRYDPGGLLSQAVEVSDLFLSEGIVVYTDGRRQEGREEYTAHREGTFEGFPMVVLINGGTASAAEIVAGALQDNDRAVVCGVKSFGKASVQNIYPLNDGSALKLTIARYYTPSGRSIQATGIEPDIIVEQRGEPEQPESDFVREEDLRHHLKADENAVDRPDDGMSRMLEKDYQLKYSLDLLKTWEVFHQSKDAA